MIKEAREFGINVLPPSMEFPVPEFTIKDEHTIYYGISNVKMTGDKEAETVISWLKEREAPAWLDVLFGLGETLKSASLENLSLSGFFKIPNISRQRMVYEYKTYRKLTNKEIEWMRNRKSRFESLKDGLVGLIEAFKNGDKDKGISRKDRVPKIEDLIKTLENPPHSLEDTPITINRNEKELLGVALTYSDIEARTLCGIETNTTCKEFTEGKSGKELTIAVSLTKVKEHKTKNSKTMVFCSGQDDNGTLESIIVFPQIYEDVCNLMVEGNTVILTGERSSDKKSFIVNRVSQI
jgi:DNA polymerase-3 subunit alpha